MARTALIQKELLRKKKVEKYSNKRKELVDIVKSTKTTLEQKIAAQRALKSMPRDSSATRMRNRCEITGRPRAFMRFFKMSRLSFRKFALEGLLPGVRKASW